MPEDKRPFVTITLGLREVKVLLAAALILAVPLWLGSESLTLSTTYPSPAGIYKKLIATGDTVLARDGGNVVIGAAATTAKLSVDGSVSATGGIAAGGGVTAGGTIRVGNFGAGSAPAGAEGALYFDTTAHKFQGYQNGQWSDLGAAQAPGGLYGLCDQNIQGGGSCQGTGCAGYNTKIQCQSHTGCSWSTAPQWYCSRTAAPAACSGPSSSPCSCPAGYTKTLIGAVINTLSPCSSCGGSAVSGSNLVFSCMKQ